MRPDSSQVSGLAPDLGADANRLYDPAFVQRIANSLFRAETVAGAPAATSPATPDLLDFARPISTVQQPVSLREPPGASSYAGHATQTPPPQPSAVPSGVPRPAQPFDDCTFDPISSVTVPRSVFDPSVGSLEAANPATSVPVGIPPQSTSPTMPTGSGSSGWENLSLLPMAKDDPLHPDRFAAMANALFRGDAAAPPGAAAAADTDAAERMIGRGLTPEPVTSRAPESPARSGSPRAYAEPRQQPGGAGIGGSPKQRLDIETARQDFPILDQKVHGKPLVWLDNAATTHKPRQVVERIRRFYYEDNSNVHRGAHTLAARATDAYEEARSKVAAFLGAPTAQEIVFVRGTTEAINLVAASFGRMALGPGDEIVVSELEHHSNIVPWQLLAQRTGARLRVARVDNDGNFLMDEYAALLNPRTRIVALTQVSNAIGTVLPVTEATALAHRVGARVLVDGAQSVQHMPVDVQAIGCDFFCFSGHKIFGPSGIGALYGRRELLDAMPPWQGGGSMIDNVTFEQSTYAPVPAKFEAGTPILAGAVGLGAAIDYVTEVGLPIIERHEAALMTHLIAGLSSISGICVIGNPKHRAGAFSFVVDGVDVPSVGALLDQQGIAVRSGHHCAQPALAHFGLKASVRPSLALYNTASDIDALIEALWRITQRAA